MEIKYHQSITTLPLSLFIECQVEGDLHALVISGSPTEEQLNDAWDNISQEYADATGDAEHRVYLSLSREVQLLDIDIALIYNCIQILEHVHIKRYADELNTLLSTDFAFDYSNREKYLQELQRCANRGKSLIIQRDQKKSRTASMEQRFKDSGKKPTREYFYSLLNILSDFAKHDIQETINVYRFCDRIRRLTEYNKQMENHNTKKQPWEKRG